MKVARVFFSNGHAVRIGMTKGEMLAKSEGQKLYDYYVPAHLECEVGSIAVVESPTSGITLVVVFEIVERETVPAQKWLVDVVDTTNYAELIRKEERRKEALALLDKKMKRIDEIKRYEMLASLDPEAAALLEEVKELSK